MELTPVTYDKNKIGAAFKYAKIPFIIVEHMKVNTKEQQIINECLTMDVDDIKHLSLEQVDKYLFMLPKALVWLQDCENDARNFLDDAQDSYDDTIGYKASMLPKSTFDVSQVTEKMRIAKVREMFPDEFEKRASDVRVRQRMLTKLSGQTKHIERLNDNLKKIRDSIVVKLTKERE